MQILRVKVNEISVSSQRIRRDYGNIEALAKSIEEIGQLQPIIVDSGYELIAGERRLRAVQSLEHEDINAVVMSFNDYVQKLEVEVSENNQRKSFTVSERVHYGKQVEELERVRASERAMKGKKEDPKENFPGGQTRDIVAQKIGFGSGKQWEKAKFVINNADDEIIHNLDKEIISLHAAYLKTKKLLNGPQEKKEKKDNEKSNKYDFYTTQFADMIQNVIQEIRDVFDIKKHTFQELIVIGSLAKDQQKELAAVLTKENAKTKMYNDCFKVYIALARKDFKSEQVQYFIDKMEEYFDRHMYAAYELITKLNLNDVPDDYLDTLQEKFEEVLEEKQRSYKQAEEMLKNMNGLTKQLSKTSDPYMVLGLNSDATLNDVKKKYQQLMKLVHPDVGGNEFLFGLIKNAYDNIKGEK